MLVNKNEELVIEADKLFKTGAVEEAIILLEKGNKTLVRALRLSGLTLWVIILTGCDNFNASQFIKIVVQIDEYIERIRWTYLAL